MTGATHYIEQYVGGVDPNKCHSTRPLDIEFLEDSLKTTRESNGILRTIAVFKIKYKDDKISNNQNIRQGSSDDLPF